MHLVRKRPTIFLWLVVVNISVSDARLDVGGEQDYMNSIDPT